MGRALEGENLTLFDLLPEDDEQRILFTPQKSTDWKWRMATDYPKESNGLKVFSCFACGGAVLWDINLPDARSSVAAR